MTDDGAAERGGIRRRALSPHRWPVRTKVIAVVAVPLALALVLAGINVRDQLAERNVLEQVAEGTRLTATVSSLIEQLQIERDETVAYVAFGRGGDRGQLEFTTDRVDRAVGALSGAAPAVAGLDPGVRDRYGAALQRLHGLAALRSTATATRLPASSVIDGYTSLIDPLLALSRDIAAAAGQTAVVRPATSLAALGRAREQAEVQHALLLASAGTGALTAPDLDALRSALAEQQAATAEFQLGATATQVQEFDDTVTGAEVDQRLRILQTVLVRAAANQPLAIDAAAWNQAADVTQDKLRAVEIGLISDLQGTSDQLVSRAGVLTAVAITLVALGALVAILLAVLIASSLITPLRRLRFAALEVAEQRLPEEIRRLETGAPPDPDDDAGEDIESDPAEPEEEVGEVARAFDTVRRQAVRLAGEQARLRANLNGLFVNLSRRSQGLVERQLALIDTLENREEDPDALAELFQLDHLATRMRRNGENLLVLGGSAPSRGVTEPVPLADLMRAAIGEVADYRRVELRPPPAVHVLGAPANDLTHLLAELLDNATTFSPPDTAVVLSASRAPDGGLVFEVVDEGLGLDAEDLAAANDRIEHPVLLDSSSPRQMGLLVVGALARRHDIVVRLLPGLETGTTGIVQTPAALLVRPEPAQTTHDTTTDAATTAAGAAPAPAPEPLLPASHEPTESSGTSSDDPLTDPLPMPDDDPAAQDVTEPIYQTLRSAWFVDHRGRTPGEGDAPPDSAAAAADEREVVSAGSSGEDGAPGDDRTWRSVADEGWDAVAARSREAPGEQTAAGLPRRRRGAGLVPGAAGVASDEVPSPRQTIDAEAIRARMGSLQAGMHRGRRESDDDPFSPVGSGGSGAGDHTDASAAPDDRDGGGSS